MLQKKFEMMMRNDSDIDNRKVAAQQLVEMYFNGDTTLEQERRLRELLADSSLTGADLDEARAVMGFMVTDARITAGRSRGHRRRWWPAVSVAASLAVIVWLAAALIIEKPQPVMLAYVGGKEIRDASQVMDIAEAELNMLGAAMDETDSRVIDELGEISQMLD